MALKVEQRDGKGFYWVLLEAHDHFEASDGLHYRMARAAASPRATYWEALLLGMSELRRIQSEGADGGDPTEGVGVARGPWDKDGGDGLAYTADPGRIGSGDAGTAAGIG